jgi:hypothetical protein
MPEAWDEIETPLRERADRVAAWIRERIAEDRYIANDVEDKDEWHCVRNNELPLVWADVVTTNALGALDETVTEDIGRSNAVHIAHHCPVRVRRQCDALDDALTDLEKLADRAEHPDTRAAARAVIVSLAGIWAEPGEIESIYLGNTE